MTDISENEIKVKVNDFQFNAKIITEIRNQSDVIEKKIENVAELPRVGGEDSGKDERISELTDATEIKGYNAKIITDVRNETPKEQTIQIINSPLQQKTKDISFENSDDKNDG